MPNPCLGITCEVAPDTAIYSLSTNLSFNGTPISVVVPCPDGFTCDPPITVTYPPGTFIVPDPPPLPPGSDPCTPRPPFRVQGCLSEIIVAIPLCSTAAQIAALAQTVIQQMALQQAQCDVYPPVTPPGGGGGTFPPPTPIVFTNAAQSVQCSNPNNVFNITALPSIPGITFAGGFLTAAAGIFGYPTQEAADAAAISFLEGLRDELLLDGDATCICFASFTATPGVSTITLNWSAVAGAGAYFISVATSGPEGPYQFLAPAQPGLSYVHSDPVVGQTYYYKINAYDNVSLSGSFLCGSDVISAIIPATPTNIFEDLVWVDNSFSGDGSAGAILNAEDFSCTSVSGVFPVSVGSGAIGDGSLTYTGPQINCRITLSTSGGSGFEGRFIGVDVDAVSVLSVPNPAAGNHDFVIPVSVAALIEVSVNASCGDGGGTGASGTSQLIGSLTVLP